MKRVETAARIAVTVILLVLAILGIIMTKEYVGLVTYHSGEGGNIYELVLDLRSPAFLWTSIYGVAVRYEGIGSGDVYYNLEGSGDKQGYL